MMNVRPPSGKKWFCSSGVTGGMMIVSWLLKLPVWIQILLVVALCAIVILYIYFSVRYHNSALKYDEIQQQHEKEMFDPDKWKNVPQNELHAACMEYYREKNRMKYGQLVVDVSVGASRARRGNTGPIMVEFKENKGQNKYKSE